MKNILKAALADSLGIVGIGSISYGGYLLMPAVGFIVLGAGLMLMAVLAGRGV